MIGLLAKTLVDIKGIHEHLNTALGNLQTLLGRITAERTSHLDIALSSRLATADDRLANLDTTLSSRLATADARLANLDAMLSSRTAATDSRLDHLDTAIAGLSTLTAAEAATQTWAEASRSLTSGTGRAVFLTAGSSWTVPADVTLIWVTCVGGGAGGIGTSTSTIGLSGGAGATIYRQPLVVAPGSLAYTLGAGGIGSTGGAAAGAGGDTSIGVSPTTYVAKGAASRLGGINSGHLGWAGNNASASAGQPGASHVYGTGGAVGTGGGIPGSNATGYGAGGGGGRGAKGGDGAPGCILIEY